MQSIDRVMKIIQVFISEEPNRFYSISELAKKCDLPISSIHRILNAMTEHEMIHQDPERKLYGLGAIWLEYGLKVYDTMDYISLLRPELERLMHSVKASVYLTKPIDMESIIIERIDYVNQTIHAHEKLGMRTPMHVGAANLAMLAHMSEEKMNQSLELVSIKNKNELHELLLQIRYDGFVVLQNDLVDGISTIAAPIQNHYRGVVGAIHVRVKNTELTNERKNGMIEDVVNTANKISWKMGYNN